MRIPLNRAVAGTAVAAAAVLTVAGTASAATGSPTAKAATTLSIVAAKNSIKAGHKDVISGVLSTVKAPVAGTFVVLDRVAGTKLIRLQAERTSKAGKVAFVVKPKVTTKYELVFPGSKKLAATHSAVATVVVTK